MPSNAYPPASGEKLPATRHRTSAVSDIAAISLPTLHLFGGALIWRADYFQGLQPAKQKVGLPFPPGKVERKGKLTNVGAFGVDMEYPQSTAPAKVPKPRYLSLGT